MARDPLLATIVLLVATASLEGARAEESESITCTGVPTTLNGEVLAVGVNYAAHMWSSNWMSDFLNSGWSGKFAAMKTELDAMKNSGAKVVRWWVFARGDLLTGASWDGDSLLSLPNGFVDNFEAAVNYANSIGLLVYPSLMSFDWCKGTHLAIFNDSTARQAWLDNAITPIATQLASNPGIFAWDLCNEPEWMINSADGGSPSTGCTTHSLATMKLFFNEVLAILKAKTYHPVSLGSASIKWLTQYTFWNDMSLDFWDFHWYSWATPYWNPMALTPSAISPTKKVIIGEVMPDVSSDSTLAAGSWCDGEACDTHAKVLKRALEQGWSGYLPWSWTDPSSNCSKYIGTALQTVTAQCVSAWSSEAVAECTLTDSFPTGTGTWGTCFYTVASGTTCAYICNTGYTAVAGTCSGNTWTTTPDCTANPCPLSSLSSNAVSWGTCNSSMPSGSSCSFSCADDYTTVSGYCLAGAWSTKPSCQECTPNKTCGTQQCGSIWNGCKVLPCGNCSSSSYCDGETCHALDSLSDWSQMLPDTYTSNNWEISSSTLKLTNVSLPSQQRLVSYNGSRTAWVSDGYTTVTVNVVATEGEVGLGLRLGQGTSRSMDRLLWRLSISGSKASSKFCAVYKGKESCTSAASDLEFSTTGSNNFTVNLVAGTKYINSMAWLNSNALTSSALTTTYSRFNNVGTLFITSKGSSVKSFANMTVRSKTAVHVVLTNCITGSSWNSFVSNLLGIPVSSVSSRGLGNDSYCGIHYRKRALEQTYAEFEVMISDELASTPSQSLANLLTEAVSGGAASWSGISVTTLAATLPEVAAATIVGTATGLSAGAIAGIVVGSVVGALAVGGVAVRAAVVIARGDEEDEDTSDSNVPAESAPDPIPDYPDPAPQASATGEGAPATPVHQRRKSTLKRVLGLEDQPPEGGHRRRRSSIFRRMLGIDIMGDTPNSAHHQRNISITARAVPITSELPHVH